MTPGRRHMLSLLAVVALASCQKPRGCVAKESDWPPPPRPGDAGVVDRYQCNRCHTSRDAGALTPAPRDKHCVHCHQAVFQGAFDDDYDAERVAGWKRRIVHLRAVPSLTGAGARFRRAWLVDFLLEPHDLRPRLEAQMPRFDMTREDAEAIARHLIPDVPEDTPAADNAPAGDAARGQELAGSLGCMSCHAFTGAPEVPASPIPVEVDGEQLALAMKLAPDLRHTRARMTRAAVIAWLEAPSAIKADSLMPRIDTTAAQRADLAAFILDAPLEEPPAREVPARLPPLEREVTWREVEQRVFKKVCWHCHSDPAPVGGDGGPGNTGGLGFAGKGIDLGTYEAVTRGGRDADGAPIDLFARDAQGTPRLVRHMMARHAEVAGHPIEGVRGMPLGLPPMSLEEIQLVESWILQGAPR